jgi:hypothetical protein
MYYSGSSRCAIGFQLTNVSMLLVGASWVEEGARVAVSRWGMHTEFEGLSFLEDLHRG